MSLVTLNPKRLQACFGGLGSFARYQRVSFLLLGSLCCLSLAESRLDFLSFGAAALMAVFDLPAVLLIGGLVLAAAIGSGRFALGPAFYTCLALGVFGGHYLAAVLHNAAHRNYRPMWLNRPLGEFAGFLLTYGFVPFRTVHRLHHSFTDEDLDPHSPAGQTMIGFMLSVRTQIFRQLRKAYFIAAGGETAQARRQWRTQEFLIVANRVFRLALLIAIFGQTNFVCFAMPCYLVNFLVFTIYNYKMHINEENGATQLRNLNESWYQRLINLTCHGVLYHENHHRDARHFDPRTLEARSVG